MKHWQRLEHTALRLGFAHVFRLFLRVFLQYWCFLAEQHLLAGVLLAWSAGDRSFLRFHSISKFLIFCLALFLCIIAQPVHNRHEKAKMWTIADNNKKMQQNTNVCACLSFIFCFVQKKKNCAWNTNVAGLLAVHVFADWVQAPVWWKVARKTFMQFYLANALCNDISLIALFGFSVRCSNVARSHLDKIDKHKS